jgi:hypothetical protein
VRPVKTISFGLSYLCQKTRVAIHIIRIIGIEIFFVLALTALGFGGARTPIHVHTVPKIVNKAETKGTDEISLVPSQPL